MRALPLHDLLASRGASFAERHGVEVVQSVSDLKTEYDHIRNAAGLTDFSFMQCYRLPEEDGVDVLDSLLAGNVARVRFGRVLHTFLADEKGELVADVYVANNDEELIVMCESLVDDSRMQEAFRAAGAYDAGMTDLSDGHVVLGVDGCKSWAVARDVFGADVLGLPYLSIEVYPFENDNVRLLRAGKTSEFGYLMVAPKEVGQKLIEALESAVMKQGGGLCGVVIHNGLRLEGRFFNIFAEGGSVKDPLALGLQWMIDFDKDTFAGREAILERRGEGLTRKMIGVSAEAGRLESGAGVFDGDSRVADVVASCRSYVLDRDIGLGLFPVDIAYSGLDFSFGSADGPLVRTISMPPIMPKSLGVKLDEM